MPTFDQPKSDAEEARQALRGLAHATRAILDPDQIYPTLGSLSAAAGAMSQSLHQLAAFHDGPAPRNGWATDDSHEARAAAYRVSWDLHRAAEILRHVAETIDHAHQAEATLVYHRALPHQVPAPARSVRPGIGL